MGKRLKAISFVYATVWSLIFGLLTGLYLQTVNWLIDFFWQFLPHYLPSKQWYPLVVCALFGLVIGFLQKRVGQYPLTINQVLTEWRSKGTVDYQRLPKLILNTLVILASGTSIGPEAGGTGIVAGLINWLGARLKIVGYRQDLEHASFLTQLKEVLFLRSKNYYRLTQKKLRPLFKSRRRQKLFYNYLTVIGLAGLVIWLKLFPEEGVFGLHFPPIHWDYRVLYLVIPAIVIGLIFGYFFVKLGKWLAPLSRTDHNLPAGLAGGLILGLLGMKSKYFMFSGEFTIVSLSKIALKMSPLFLLLLGIGKAVLTNLNFNLGFRGGTIFPAIFCSLAVSAVLPHFFVWMPNLVATIGVAVSVTVILNRPLLTAALLIFLMPLPFAPFVVLACYLTAFLQKKFAFLRP